MSVTPRQTTGGKPQATRDYPPALWQLSLVLREIASGTMDKQASSGNDVGNVPSPAIRLNPKSKGRKPKRLFNYGQTRSNEEG